LLKMGGEGGSKWNPTATGQGDSQKKSKKEGRLTKTLDPGGGRVQVFAKARTRSSAGGRKNFLDSRNR